MTTASSPLREALEGYLALRRALGFRLAAPARLLGQFVGYLEARGTSTITISDALAWAALPAGASPAWQAIRLSAVRGFAAYLHGTDPSVQVPPAGLIRRGNDRATPYLYSEAEISAIIAAAAGLRPRFRAATYQALISLLAVSGVRIGEAIALDRGNLGRAYDRRCRRRVLLEGRLLDWRDMDTKELVQRFYDGLARKDGSWQDNLSENVAFSDASGKLSAQGREAFIQSFSGFLRAVDKVLLKQLIVEGPNAAAVVSYDYVNPSGGHLHQDDAEVWKVENGQIVSLTIYFDITEFRGFMGR
jgi:ketosteroid isomerase-like protein